MSASLFGQNASCSHPSSWRPITLPSPRSPSLVSLLQILLCHIMFPTPLYCFPISAWPLHHRGVPSSWLCPHRHRSLLLHRLDPSPATPNEPTCSSSWRRAHASVTSRRALPSYHHHRCPCAHVVAIAVTTVLCPCRRRPMDPHPTDVPFWLSLASVMPLSIANTMCLGYHPLPLFFLLFPLSLSDLRVAHDMLCFFLPFFFCCTYNWIPLSAYESFSLV